MVPILRSTPILTLFKYRCPIKTSNQIRPANLSPQSFQKQKSLFQFLLRSKNFSKGELWNAYISQCGLCTSNRILHGKVVIKWWDCSSQCVHRPLQINLSIRRSSGCNGDSFLAWNTPKSVMPKNYDLMNPQYFRHYSKSNLGEVHCILCLRITCVHDPS